ILSAAWSTAIPAGSAPTAAVGASLRQSVVFEALQPAGFTTETVLSTKLATYTVPVAGSVSTAWGPSPTWEAGGRAPQPDVSSALQVSELTADSVSSRLLIT